MSYLIAKQNEEKTNDYVESGKKQRLLEKKSDDSGDYEPSSSSSEDKRKTPLKGLKKHYATFQAATVTAKGTQNVPTRHDCNYLY